MGYYIETGTSFHKAEIIASRFGGEILPEPPAKYSDIPEGKALIVVVDNGIFEAAGFCYDESEFLVFTDPHETRPRQYVLLGRLTAEHLSGYKRENVQH